MPSTTPRRLFNVTIRTVSSVRIIPPIALTVPQLAGNTVVTQSSTLSIPMTTALPARPDNTSNPARVRGCSTIPL